MISHQDIGEGQWMGVLPWWNITLCTATFLLHNNTLESVGTDQSVSNGDAHHSAEDEEHSLSDTESDSSSAPQEDPVSGETEAQISKSLHSGNPERLTGADLDLLQSLNMTGTVNSQQSATLMPPFKSLCIIIDTVWSLFMQYCSCV